MQTARHAQDATEACDPQNLQERHLECHLGEHCRTVLYRICSKSTYASCKCILHLQIVRIWETNFRF